MSSGTHVLYWELNRLFAAESIVVIFITNNKINTIEGDLKVRRFGSVFRIRPDYKDEYKKAHDDIWPELVAEIKKLGIKNYSIFYRKDGTLFSYFESDLDLEEFQTRWKEYFKKDISKKWQKYMNEFIIKEDNTSTGSEFIVDLEEVFHLE
jgi:L-rhamnose mutarotase